MFVLKKICGCRKSMWPLGRGEGTVSCILLYIWVFFTLLPYESPGGHYPSDNKEIILKVVTKLLTLDTGVLNLVQSRILNSPRIIFRAEPLA